MSRSRRSANQPWLDPAALSQLPTDTLSDLLTLDAPLSTLEAEDRDRSIARFRRYANDPVGFATAPEVLNDHLWSKQREIAISVRDNRYTAVQSAHGVGKSFIASRIVAWWLSTSPLGEAFAVTTAPTFPQVRIVLWREITRAHARAHLPGRTNQTEWLLGNELIGVGRKPSDYSVAAFQGIHARRVLVLLDEACGIIEGLWDAIDSLVTSAESRVLAIGNPDDPLSHFAKVCRPGSGYHRIKISAFDSPNLTGEAIPSYLEPLLPSVTWVEERRKRWGEASPVYTSKVLGEFPDVSDDALIPVGWVTAAVNADLATGVDPGYLLPSELGVDVARFGNDESVIVHRRGPVARIAGTARRRDLMHLVGLVVNAIRTCCPTPSRVKIDDVGLGGGVTDRLKEVLHDHGLAVEVVPVNVGNVPTRVRLAEKFFNLKAELAWNLRERFEAGEVDLADDEELLAQLTSIRYLLDSRGRIRIEEKSEAKARGLPSPDRADALILAYADVARPRRVVETRAPSPAFLPIYAR